MNSKYAALCAVLFCASSCGSQESGLNTAESPKFSLQSEPNFTENAAALSSAKLREYCRACHAVGSLRFIYDENDQNIWSHILTKNVPGKSELWARAIVRVLSWPTEGAPAPSPVMDPPSGRDWMPKGSKRLHFAGDKIDGISARQYILRAINDDLAE